MEKSHGDSPWCAGELYPDPAAWLPDLSIGKSVSACKPAWVLAGTLWSMSRIPSFRELLATALNECRALVYVLVTSALRDGSANLVTLPPR